MKTAPLADLGLLFVAFIWGTTFVLVQNAVRVMEPMTFNGVRFCLAFFLLLIIVCLVRPKVPRKEIGDVIGKGLLLGGFLFAGYALQTIGLVYTTSAKAGFITGLSVVLVPLFVWAFYQKRPATHAFLGPAFAVCGLYFLTMEGTLAPNFGDLLVLFCAVAFAMHIVFTGRFSARAPALFLTTVQMGTVAVLSFAGAFLFENWRVAFSPTVLGHGDVLSALFVTSLFATVLAYFIQTKLQKQTPATHVAIIFAMEPVFAALCGVIYAGESLTAAQWFGSALIFSSMILSEWKKRRLQARTAK